MQFSSFSLVYNNGDINSLNIIDFEHPESSNAHTIFSFPIFGSFKSTHTSTLQRLLLPIDYTFDTFVCLEPLYSVLYISQLQLICFSTFSALCAFEAFEFV